VDKNPELKEEIIQMSSLGMSIATKNFDAGRIEGLTAGRAEGLTDLSFLMQMLLSANRIEDAMKVSTDAEYRDKMLEEYKKIEIKK